MGAGELAQGLRGSKRESQDLCGCGVMSDTEYTTDMFPGCTVFINIIGNG